MPEEKVFLSKEMQTKPVIEAGDITLKVGSKCDLLVGVNATDWKGRDISRNIRVLGEKEIDVNKAGVYFIDYWVTDKWGKFATCSVKVIIE